MVDMNMNVINARITCVYDVGQLITILSPLCDCADARVEIGEFGTHMVKVDLGQYEFEDGEGEWMKQSGTAYVFCPPDIAYIVSGLLNHVLCDWEPHEYIEASGREECNHNECYA